jgi:RES domain-containing protein
VGVAAGCFWVTLAAEIETAIAETVYHHTKRLGHSAGGFRHMIQMRELISVIDAEVCDVRGLREIDPDLYDPESYADSQPFGEALRHAGQTELFIRASAG